MNSKLSNHHLLMPSWVTSNLLILFSAGFCFWFSLGSLLPTLPLFVRELGGTPQQIGFVMGAFAIGLMATRSSLGILADKHSRKLVLLIGLAVAAVTPCAFILTTQISLLLALRVFHGISIAAFMTAYDALVADLADPKKRGEIIGAMSQVTPIGEAFGTAFGGMSLATPIGAGFGITFGSQALEFVNYWVIFGCAALFGALGFALVLKVHDPSFKDAKNLEIKHQPPPKQAVNQNTNFPDSPHNHPALLRFKTVIRLWEYIIQPRLRMLTLIMFVAGITFGTLTSFMPLHVQDLRIQFNPGLFYTVASIATFGVRLLIGRASDQVGRGRFISLSLILYGLSMLLLGLGTSSESIFLSAILQGTSVGLIIPMALALMADRSSPHERARVFSVCMGGFDIGLAIAGPLFGSFSDWIQLQTVFIVVASLCWLGLFTFALFSNRTLKRSLQFAFSNGRDSYAIADRQLE